MRQKSNKKKDCHMHQKNTKGEKGLICNSRINSGGWYSCWCERMCSEPNVHVTNNFTVQYKQNREYIVHFLIKYKKKENLYYSTWQAEHLVPASPSLKADPDRQGLQNHRGRALLLVCWWDVDCLKKWEKMKEKPKLSVQMSGKNSTQQNKKPKIICGAYGAR